MTRWTKIVSFILSVATLLSALVAWQDARYAKAEDVQDIKETVQDLAIALQLGQLQNRRAVLRGEQFQLQNSGRRTVLERQRLADVDAELREVEADIVRLKARTR